MIMSLVDALAVGQHVEDGGGSLFDRAAGHVDHRPVVV